MDPRFELKSRAWHCTPVIATWKVQSGRSVLYGHHQLHSEFKAGLGYKWSSLTHTQNSYKTNIRSLKSNILLKCFVFPPLWKEQSGVKLLAIQWHKPNFKWLATVSHSSLQGLSSVGEWERIQEAGLLPLLTSASSFSFTYIYLLYLGAHELPCVGSEDRLRRVGSLFYHVTSVDQTHFIRTSKRFGTFTC